MRQPELGKILTNLRNEKGLTQEELVEKCNISVRTIQRIEAGEVTPRSYTIKTILAALDQNLETIAAVFSLDDSNPLLVSKKELKILSLAFIIGIVYFILGFVEVFVEADLEFNKTLAISSEFYVSLKIISCITMLFFYAGFVVSGTIFKNYLLRISSILLMVIFGIAYVFDIYSWFSPSESEGFLWIMLCIFIGCALVLHGISILRLKKHVGVNLSTVTAVLVISAGAAFITVLLFLIGLIFLIPMISVRLSKLSSFGVLIVSIIFLVMPVVTLNMVYMLLQPGSIAQQKLSYYLSSEAYQPQFSAGIGTIFDFLLLFIVIKTYLNINKHNDFQKSSLNIIIPGVVLYFSFSIIIGKMMPVMTRIGWYGVPFLVIFLSANISNSIFIEKINYRAKIPLIRIWLYLFLISQIARPLLYDHSRYGILNQTTIFQQVNYLDDRGLYARAEQKCQVLHKMGLTFLCSI